MNTFVSMLRGINVGGNKRLAMSELTKLYTSLSFVDVQTYLQSGNVIFKHRDADSTSHALIIEQGPKSKFGFDVNVFVRTPNELKRIVAGNPFHGKDPTKLHVTFLYTRPGRIPIDDIDPVVGRGEAFSVSGKEVHLFAPNGYGRTKLSNGFFERVLKIPATTRNWSTVTALSDIAREVSAKRS